MNKNNTSYQRNRVRFLEQAKSHYCHKNGK